MAYARNAALIARYQAGDRAAAEELLSLNSGLIAGIARRYLHSAGSLEMEDLLQEGRLGLLRAAANFDGTRGTVFSTVAVPHVHRAIQRAIERMSSPIRLPTHVHDRARKAAATGEEQDWLAQLPRVTISLDAEIGEDGDSRLGDLIPGENNDVEEFVNREWAAHVLAILTPRERGVIERRCGLGCTGRTETLGEVAERLRLTREGVRQVEVRALRKLRQMETRESVRAG